MLGNFISQSEFDDCWSYLCVIGNIASELIPNSPPSYIPHVALAQEFELANALYYMSRSVKPMSVQMKNWKKSNTCCYT